MSSVARALVALFLSVSLATFGAGCLHHESLEEDEEELEEEELGEEELGEEELGEEELGEEELVLTVDGRRVEVRDLDPEDLSESELIGEQELVPHIGATLKVRTERECKARGGLWLGGQCYFPEDDKGNNATGTGVAG